MWPLLYTPGSTIVGLTSLADAVYTAVTLPVISTSVIVVAAMMDVVMLERTWSMI
jgi:hypothetical protein